MTDQPVEYVAEISRNAGEKWEGPEGKYIARTKDDLSALLDDVGPLEAGETVSINIEAVSVVG